MPNSKRLSIFHEAEINDQYSVPSLSLEEKSVSVINNYTRVITAHRRTSAMPFFYHRNTLSFRDIEALSTSRNIAVTYETIRKRFKKFGPVYSNKIRNMREQLGDNLFLDGVLV